MNCWAGVCCILLVAIVASALETVPINWNATYMVLGKLFIPSAEVEERFSAYYDSVSGRSRITFERVVNYQLTREYQYGTSVTFLTVGTADGETKGTCLQVNGTQDNVIEMQSMLPNLKNFTFAGSWGIWKYGISDCFVLNEIIGQKKNVYTFCVGYEKSPEHPGSRIPIPRRYEMTGINTLSGLVYDHYYIEYEMYHATDELDKYFVNIDLPFVCIPFPGPAQRQYPTFNPMKEFIYPTVTDHVDHEFNRFKNKYNKKYEHDEEHERRKDVFRQNLRFIRYMNRDVYIYTLAVNHLADQTKEEIMARRGFRSSNIYNGGKPFPYDTQKFKNALPEQHDWRIFGAVTQVKDQSVCGSCWSFGTIGAIEGAYFLKSGTLVRLSQQALIDCSWGYGNNGCDGGEDFRAYNWMMKMGGVPTEEEYGPYLGQDGYCHANNVTFTAPITGFVNVTANDPDAFKLAMLKHGPLSIAIHASRKTFAFYSHGIYYDYKCKNELHELDHAVLAVGYGIINGKEYWLVKNSWSDDWGNDGYILMSTRDNNCGVMTTPTYVTM